MAPSLLKTKSDMLVHPIGIGTWEISSELVDGDVGLEYKARPRYGNEEQEIEAIRFSLDHGQNHIDCAELYGGFYTDEVIGKAIQGYIRQDLYIADKLWKKSVGVDCVRPTLMKMFEKLNTDYIDLLYIHAPFDDADWKLAISQIDNLIDEGLVLGFGVSNFTIEQLKETNDISRNKIKAVQQNFSIGYQIEADKEYRKYCHENDIALIAYRPMMRNDIVNNEKVQKLAGAYNASPYQIALAWIIALGAYPIPKATNKDHVKDNLGALDLELSASDIEFLIEA